MVHPDTGKKGRFVGSHALDDEPSSPI